MRFWHFNCKDTNKFRKMQIIMRKKLQIPIFFRIFARPSTIYSFSHSNYTTMKKLFFSLILLASLGVGVVCADEAQDLFDRAKALAEGGDRAAAVALYEKAAQMGHFDAKAELASYYLNIDDYDNAFKWYSVISQEQDIPVVDFILGSMYMLGRGTSVDTEKGLALLKKSANSGNLMAQSTLGSLYDGGKVVEQNDCEAMKWYKMAAEQNDAESQVMVGAYYMLGKCVDKNLFTAADWFKKAADNGSEDGKQYYERVTAIIRKAGELFNNLSKKKVEATYFDIEYDGDLWDAEPLDMQTELIPDAYMLSYKKFTDVVSIIYYDATYEAEAFFKNQIVEKGNHFFSDARIMGDYEQTTLWGNPGYFAVYQKTINNELYSGVVMMTNANNGVMFVYTITNNLKDSKFMDIVNGVTVKKVEKQKMSFEEMATAAAQLINERQPVVADGLVLTALTPDFKKKTMTYTYQFLQVEKTNINLSVITKEMLVGELQKEFSANSMTQEMLRQGYSLKYSYLDKNREYVGAITITPDDYKAILK